MTEQDIKLNITRLDETDDECLRGIQIKSFGISEALVRSVITFSYSDAKQFCDRNENGSFTNEKFRDIIIGKLTKELLKVIEEKGK